MKVSVQAQEEAKEAELTRKELGLQEGVDNLKALIQVNVADFPHSPLTVSYCVYVHSLGWIPVCFVFVFF